MGRKKGRSGRLGGSRKGLMFGRRPRLEKLEDRFAIGSMLVSLPGGLAATFIGGRLSTAVEGPSIGSSDMPTGAALDLRQSKTTSRLSICGEDATVAPVRPVPNVTNSGGGVDPDLASNTQSADAPKADSGHYGLPDLQQQAAWSAIVASGQPILSSTGSGRLTAYTSTSFGSPPVCISAQDAGGDGAGSGSVASTTASGVSSHSTPMAPSALTGLDETSESTVTDTAATENTSSATPANAPQPASSPMAFSATTSLTDLGPSLIRFSSDLANWDVEQSGGTIPSEGQVYEDQNDAVMEEGNSFVVTLGRSFTVPDTPSEIAFTYTDLSFDTTDPDFINDAFEVSLVDAEGYPLVPTIGPGFDAFFNMTESLASPAIGDTATTESTADGQRVVLDISSVLPGQTATLVFRLVNNDSDTGTSVRILGGASPPVLEPLDDFEADEGSAVTLLAAFSDPGDGELHTSTVDWGDGTVTTADVTESNDGGSISATHVYADNGTYTIRLDLTDASELTSTEEAVAAITNVAPKLNAMLGFEGQAAEEPALPTVRIQAEFTDPGFNRPTAGTSETFTTTIDWGDGSIEPITVDITQGSDGVLTEGGFLARHEYQQGGSFHVVVTVTDDDGGSDQATFDYAVGRIDVKPAVRSPGWDPTDAQTLDTSLPHGLIPVIVRSEPGFDAPNVLDVTSLHLNPGYAPDSNQELLAFDVTDDGLTDAILHFSTWETRIRPTTEVVTLTGTLHDGSYFVGMGSLRVTPASSRIPDAPSDSHSEPGNTKFFVVDAEADSAFRYDAAGADTGAFTLHSTYTTPSGVTSNATGDTVWILDNASHHVSVHGPDGWYRGSWLARSVRDPQGIATDGQNIWIVDAEADAVLHYANAADRLSQYAAPDAGSFLLHTANTSAQGIATDGAKLWVVDDAADAVFVYDTSGTYLGRWQLDPENADPSGITSDPTGGDTLWVVDRADALVYQYDTATTALAGSLAAAATFALASTNTQPEGIADPPAAPDGSVSSLDLTIEDLDTTGLVYDAQSLTVSGSVSATVTVGGTGDVTGPVEVVFFEDFNLDGVYDPAIDISLGSTSTINSLSGGMSVPVVAQLSGPVQFVENIIWGFVDSGNLIEETNETNNLARPDSFFVPRPGEFNPVVEWHAMEGNHVVATPMVINLTDDNGDGRIDALDVPDVVFVAFTGSQRNGGRLVALSGDDGHELFAAGGPSTLAALGEVAVGDLDSDGLPEIVASHVDGRHLVAFEHNGEPKWISDDDVLPARADSGGAISIANLDGIGTPEIVIGASVYSADGNLLGDGRDLGGTYGRNSYAAISCVADVDLDGTPEIIAGPSAYRFMNGELSLIWHRADIHDGFTAVANLDDDPYAEVVVVGNGRVFALNHDGTDSQVWNDPGYDGIPLPGGGAGGAPTIGDYDGDQRPEIGVAGSSRYVVFENDGSIRWSAVTSDNSSNTTGSTTFDFEGDGKAEVVYRDEHYLRVYSGDEGKVLYETPMSSATATEMPVIADVDGDGNAEIVVGADTYFWGNHSGIYVIGDLNDTWVPTRQIWNQHTYHVTNVNDDGTIPTHEENSWEVHNTYRLNSQPGLDPHSAPDLTASYLRASGSGVNAHVTARIGNGGELFVAAGVPVAFYDDDPQNGGTLLGAAVTTTRLEPGRFEDVSITVPQSSIANREIWVVADDDGTGQGTVSESDELNNVHHTRILSAIQISTESPDDGSEFPTDTELVISGNAVSWGQLLGPNDVRRDRQILSVTIDGTPVDTLDSAGNFFTSVTVGPGENVFEFEALDELDQTATTTLTLVGTQTSPGEFDNLLFDVSPSFDPEYARTTFDERTDHLFAELAVQNLGGYSADNPFLVGVKNLSEPSVSVVDPVGVTPEGIPYYNLSDVVPGDSLDPTEITALVHAVFHNPDRIPFDYELVFLSKLNTPPRFDTIPVLEALVDQPYIYPSHATDPDGDTLTYTLVTGPSSMTIDPATGIVSWTPTPADLGNHDIILQATDGRGGTAEQHYQLALIDPPPNRPPVFTSVPVTMGRVGEAWTREPVGDVKPDRIVLSRTLEQSVQSVGLSLADLGVDVGSADVVFVVDESGSMDTEHDWLDDMISDLDVSLTRSGIIGNRYGLVGYADTARVLAVDTSQPLMSADDFVQATAMLSTGRSGSEDGYRGIEYAVASYPFRDDAARAIVLVTDEDRTTVDRSLTFDSIDTLLQDQSFVLHGVLNAVLEGIYSERAFGVDSQGNAYIESGDSYSTTIGGEFVRSESVGGGSIAGIKTDYVDLVWGMNGATWDLNLLREGGTTATLFSEAFVDYLKGDILRQIPVTVTVDAGVGGFTNLSGTISGRSSGQDLLFDVSFSHAELPPEFDLIFKEAETGQIFGRIPVSFQDTGYRYDSEAVDPDLDPVSYRIVDGPTGMSIDSATGLVLWSPTSDQTGSHPVTLEASDGRGGIAEQSYTICVFSDSSNRPPVIVTQPVTEFAPDEITGASVYRTDVDAIDPDSDALVYSLVNSPAGMTIDSETGVIDWNGSPRGRELVVNGGGETGDATGWDSSEFVTVNADNPPHDGFPRGSGDYFFWVGEGPSSGQEMIQTIHVGEYADAIDNNRAVVDVAIDIFAGDNEDGYASFTFVGASGETLDSIDFEALRSGVTFAWLEFRETTTVPAGTRSIEVRLVGTRPSGRWTDVFIDDVSIILAAETDVTARVEDGRGGFDEQSFTIEVLAPGTGEIRGQKTIVSPIVFAHDFEEFADNVLIPLIGPNANKTSNLTVDTAGLSELGSSSHVTVSTTGFAHIDTNTKLESSTSELSFSILYNDRGDNGSDISQTTRSFARLLSSCSGTGIAADELVFDIGPLDGSGNRRLRFVVGGKTVSSDAVIPARDALWHQAGVVFNNGNVTFYFDGQPISGPTVLTGVNELPVQARNWFLIEDATSVSRPDEYYDGGSYDNAVLWYRAVSGDTMQELHSSGLSVVTPVNAESAENWTVYLDQNQNRRRDTGERFTLTDDQGNYAFTGLPEATYYVAEQQQPGWRQTAPEFGMYSLPLTDGEILTGIDFGNMRTDATDNVPPTFASDPPTEGDPDVVLRYPAKATDPNGDPITFDLVTAPDGMTVHPDLGVVVWHPTADQLGTHQVTLCVQDAHGGVDLQSFELTVSAANTSPVFTSVPAEQAVVDRPYVYRLQTQDADGDPVGLTLDLGPAGMTLQSRDVLDEAGGTMWTVRELVWTPGAGDVGPNMVRVVADDGNGGVTNQEYQLTVVEDAVNTAPVIVSTPRTDTRIDAPYLYLVETSQLDGDPLAFHLDEAPAGMTISPEDGIVRWTPAGTQAGSHSVTVRVDDGRGGEDSQTFVLHVSVQGENDPPVIVSTPRRSALAMHSYVYDVLASDPDGDPISWDLIQSPHGMSIDPLDGTIRWTPTVEQLGTHEVIVQASDPYLATATQTFTIGVSCRNRFPAITSTPPTEAAAERTYTYPVRAADPEGDPLTFQLLTSPAGMSIDESTGLIRFVPAADQIGSHHVAVEVTDGNGGYATQAYDLQVGAVGQQNQPPVITSRPPAAARPGTAYNYVVLASDPEGESLVYTLVDPPAGMTIHPQFGLIEWTPVAADQGEHTIVVVATDPAGLRATQAYSLIVRPNQGPAITSSPPTEATPGGTYRYDVIAVDPEGDTLAYTLDQGPDGMEIDRMGRVRWQPTFDDMGASFDIGLTIADPFGAQASETFTITVVSDNQPPLVEIAASTNLVDAGGTVLFQARATDNVGVDTLWLLVDGVVTPFQSNNNGIHEAIVPFDTPGLVDVVAQATDLAGNTGQSESRQVRVFDPNDQEHPIVTIHAPAHQDIITYLTDVVVSIEDDNLSHWRVEYARADDIDLNRLAADDPDFRLLAEGTETLDQVTVGVFDPTVLANDAYILRAIAFDVNGQGWAEPVAFGVSGNAKLGNFAFTVTDFSVSLAGIPIQINRTYDTLDANRQGDFGYGWSLGLQSANIAETTPSNMEMQSGDRVYLTNPEGRRVGFEYTPTYQGSWFGTMAYPAFTPDPGVYDTLAVKDGPYGVGGILGALGGGWNPSQYVLTTRDGSVYEYVQGAGLEKITDQNDNTLTFTDTAIVHSGGAQIDLVRDARGRITEIIDTAGNSIEYTYDTAGDLVGFTNQIDETTTYEYLPTPAHFLDSIHDPDGVRIFKADFDVDGRLTGTTDALGNVVQQDFDPAAFEGTITDARGNVTTLRYNDQGNVTEEVSDAIVNPITGQTTTYTKSYEYADPNHPDKETKVVEFDGTVVEYKYDAAGNTIETTRTAADGSQSSTSRFDYDTDGNLTTLATPGGGSSTFNYNATGEATSIVAANGEVASATYVDGRQTSFTDFNLNTTTYEYKAACPCGTPEKTIHADGSYELRAWNRYADITSVEYYDAGDNLVHAIKTDYDNLRRKTRETTGTGADAVVVDYTYDGSTANVATETIVHPTDLSQNRVTHYEYDAAGNLVRQVDPDLDPTDPTAGIFFKYDAAGNRVWLMDPVGNVTTWIYDSLDRVIEERDPLHWAGTDWASMTDTEILDLIDDPTPVGAAPYGPSHTTLYAYDGADNLTEQIDRNGRRRTFDYDYRGNMLEEVWYDATDDVTPIREMTFSYDTAGNMLTAVDPDAEYVFTYDTMNRLETMSVDYPWSANFDTFTLTYDYDPMGNVTSVRDNLGVETKSQYDNRNRLARRDWLGASIDEARVDFLYTAIGQTKRIDRYSDLTATNLVAKTDYLWDTSGRPDQIRHADASDSIFAQYDYQYDFGGLLTQEALTHRNTTYNRTADYSYDPRGQLLSAVYNNTQPDEHFTYDANGNRTLPGYTTGPGNQLLSDGTHNYTYDAAGNMVTKTRITPEAGEVNHTEYDYDFRNRMTSITQYSKAPGEGGLMLHQESYRYDVLNRRIAITSGQEVTARIFDGDQVWLAIESSGESTRNLVDIQGAILFTNRSDAPSSWRLLDHLGTARDVLSSSSFLQRLECSAYGLPVGQSMGDVSTPEYAGQPINASTGLILYGSRNYDPSLGQFISSDPIRFAGNDSNLYRYAANNPINFIDPTGTMALLGYVSLLTPNFQGAMLAGIGQMYGFGMTNLIYAGYTLATSDPQAALALTSAHLLHMFGMPIGLKTYATAGGDILNLAALLLKIPVLMEASKVVSKVVGPVNAFYFGYDLSIGVKINPKMVLGHYGQILHQIIKMTTGTDPFPKMEIKTGKFGGFLAGSVIALNRLT